MLSFKKFHYNDSIFLKGFDKEIKSITFGTTTCSISSITSNEIHCMTEESSSTGRVDVNVLFEKGQSALKTNAFEYTSAASVEISSVLPKQIYTTLG